MNLNPQQSLRDLPLTYQGPVKRCHKPIRYDQMLGLNYAGLLSQSDHAASEKWVIFLRGGEVMRLQPPGYLPSFQNQWGSLCAAWLKNQSHQP